MYPYQILEVANTHGGDLEYLKDLITEFESFEGFGMKFQPLDPDRIATSDFTWYPVYKELFFNSNQWGEIIEQASKTKEIWLDIFDTYGVEIFEENRSLVKGIKLQSSILFNYAVINALEVQKLEGHILIINISGLEMDQIKERILVLSKLLKPTELWIEVGFQAYPTQLQDSGYVKIKKLKETTGCKIVFADHADANGDDSIWLPIVAALKGADVIEKHVCHSERVTKYDHYSSITKSTFQEYLLKLNQYIELNNQPFINEREYEYLKKTIQVPIAKRKLNANSLIDVNTDLDFKRSGLTGLNTMELLKLQLDKYLLSTNVPEGHSFKYENFKKANIATIIACRLKSSRLPKKALLKIGELTSVERCIRSCLQFRDINHTILATSDLAEDFELHNYTFSPSVIFHTGDAEDVIRRYLSIADQLKIDIIIRVTADCPFVSCEIVSLLLASHFDKGADYTAARFAAVGSSAEIINVSALRFVKDSFPSANYSEYMTWYFQNNPEYFKLNFVDLPNDLVRDYRLTLDYPEDLDLFNKIQNYFDTNNLSMNLREIFKFLDTHENLARINSHLALRYKSDTDLIDTLNRATKINSIKL